MVAGEAESVRQAFVDVEVALRDLNLELNISKCELIPTARGSTNIDLTAFPVDMKRVGDGCFKFLGAPIGSIEGVHAPQTDR